MRRLFVLLSVLFVLTGCPPTERTIEDTICYIREVNNSSRNVYIQYYYKIPPNDTIFLERIHLDSDSEYNTSNSDYDHCDPGINYGDVNYRSTPGYGSIETIEKIVIVDIDSCRLLLRMDNPRLVIELEHANDNYDMRCRFEYYILNITDELFE
ncbi:MAG: hypothetical protein LBT11_06925 [Treponema sp.]|nr:hypothetical protein [Treponema sp.]